MDLLCAGLQPCRERESVCVCGGMGRASGWVMCTCRRRRYEVSVMWACAILTLREVSDSISMRAIVMVRRRLCSSVEDFDLKCAEYGGLGLSTLRDVGAMDVLRC